jgi:putative aldouronate transport system permease protein
LKSACIMFATIPIVIVYPFIQKYFVKGVMIGAVKE